MATARSEAMIAGVARSIGPQSVLSVLKSLLEGVPISGKLSAKFFVVSKLVSSRRIKLIMVIHRLYGLVCSAIHALPYSSGSSSPGSRAVATLMASLTVPTSLAAIACAALVR